MFGFLKNLFGRKRDDDERRQSPTVPSPAPAPRPTAPTPPTLTPPPTVQMPRPLAPTSAPAPIVPQLAPQQANDDLRYQQLAEKMRSEGRDPSEMLQARRDSQMAQRQSQYDNSLAGKTFGFGKEAGKALLSPLANTAKLVPTLGAEVIADWRGNPEEQRIARENMRELMPETFPGMLFNSLGTIAAPIAASAAEKSLVKQGIDPRIANEAALEETARFGFSPDMSTKDLIAKEALAGVDIGSNIFGISYAPEVLSPIRAGVNRLVRNEAELLASRNARELATALSDERPTVRPTEEPTIRPTKDPNSPISAPARPTTKEPAITSPNRPKPTPEIVPPTLTEVVPPRAALPEPAPLSTPKAAPVETPTRPVETAPTKAQAAQIEKALEEATPPPAPEPKAAPTATKVETPLQAETRAIAEAQASNPTPPPSAVAQAEASLKRSQTPSKTAALDTPEGAVVKESVPEAKPTNSAKEYTRLVETYRDSVYAGDAKAFEKMVSGKKAQASINETREKTLRQLAKTPDEDIVSQSVRVAATTIDDATGAVEAQTRLFKLNQISRQIGADGKPTKLAEQAKDLELGLLNQIDDFASRSGMQLRSTQVAYAQMTPAQQTKYLKKRMKVDDLDFTPEQNKIINGHLEAAADIKKQIGGDIPGETGVEDKLRSKLEQLRGDGGASVEDVRTYENMAKRYTELQAQYENLTGKAVKSIQDFASKGQPFSAKRVGQNVANLQRQSMLSTVTGRLFDLGSTANTVASDLAIDYAQSALAFSANKALKRNVFKQSTALSPKELVKGGAKGIKDSFRELRTGVADVKDPTRFIQQSQHNRGDLLSPRTPIGRAVGFAVSLPDAATKGIREADLLRQGKDVAKQLGIKDKGARELYAKIYQILPDAQADIRATQMWRKANMMHDNKLTKVAEKAMGGIVQNAGPFGGIIKNGILPFTRYGSGYVNRLVMEKNVVARMARIGNALAKKDPDAALHHTAGLAVDVAGGALVAGTVLPALGYEIVDHDENGDSYDGLYLKKGNQYYSMGLFGLAAPNVALSYLWNKNAQDSDKGMVDKVLSTGADWVATMTKQASISSTLGLDSPLVSNSRDIISGVGSKDGQQVKRAGLPVIGNIIGQGIPGITRDVNAVLDQSTSLNPTGERPETKATEINLRTGRERRDVLQTEKNKLQSQIPFLSQQLPRKPGTIARNLFDRAVKGGRSSETQEQAIADAKVQAERKVSQEERDMDYRKRGVPSSTDGVTSALEKGDWKMAIEGEKWAKDRAGDDGEISEETKARYDKKVKTYELFESNKWSYDDYKAYTKSDAEDGGVNLTNWRKMLETDPDRAERLWQIDQAMVEAGLRKEPKYSLKASGSGSGSRGKTTVSLPSLAKAANATGGGAKYDKATSLFKPVMALKAPERVGRVRTPSISVKRGVHV